MDNLKINKTEKILFIVVIVLTFFTTLINFNDFWFLYIFAIVFIAAGIFVTIYAPFFGLIFLVTHSGIAGLSILKAAMEIGNIFGFLNSPLLSDGNVSNIYTYLGIALSLFIISVSLLVTQNIYNGVMTLKRKKMTVTYALVGVYLLFIAFFMIQLLPHIYMHLIQ